LDIARAPERRVKLQVTDDSGLLALVDPDAYSGFIAEDWAWEDMVARFHEEMAARHLLIWGTGQEGCWTVDVSLSRAVEAGIREVAGSIVATKGRLLVTNYESLTMIAQFSDLTLPEPHETALVVDVPPGLYRCRVVQHALEAANWAEGCDAEFRIELQPAKVPEPTWAKIPWSEGL
jgi:hypothetical protein